MDERTEEGGQALTVVGARRHRKREPRVESRDFRRPARPTGTQLRELEGFASRIGAQIRATIANRLKTAVQCEPGPPDVSSFGEDVERQPDDAWLLPLVSDQEDRAVLVVDGALQRHFITRFLGGVQPKEDEDEDEYGEDEDDDEEVDADAEAETPKKELPVGPISRAALFPIVRSILKDVGALLREEVSETAVSGEEDDLYKIDDARMHSAPRRWMRSTEAITVLYFDVAESGGGGRISLILPSLSIGRFIRSEESALVPTHVDAGVRRRLETMVRDLGMGLTLRLGGATIDLAEFLRLAPGDVLVLDRRVGEALDVFVGKEKRFTGQPGRSRGRLAVRILGRCDQKEES